MQYLPFSPRDFSKFTMIWWDMDPFLLKWNSDIENQKRISRLVYCNDIRILVKNLLLQENYNLLNFYPIRYTFHRSNKLMSFD